MWFGTDTGCIVAQSDPRKRVWKTCYGVGSWFTVAHATGV